MTALLERSGLPILETFRVVEGMLMPGPVKRLVGEIRRQVVSGNSITGSVAGTNVLPDLVEQMITVGESSGKIDETLMAAADHYEDETRVKIKRLTVALEPLLTLLVSALVMGMALAIFLPMWEMHALLLKK
jgi:MSHA biogenesis protein MshG